MHLRRPRLLPGRRVIQTIVAIVAIAAIAILGIVGTQDRRSAEISHQIAMDAPRPVFEPANEARQLSMPCPYIQMKRFEHEPVSSSNTRCANTDRSE